MPCEKDKHKKRGSGGQQMEIKSKCRSFKPPTTHNSPNHPSLLSYSSGLKMVESDPEHKLQPRSRNPNTQIFASSVRMRSHPAGRRVHHGGCPGRPASIPSCARRPGPHRPPAAVLLCPGRRQYTNVRRHRRGTGHSQCWPPEAYEVTLDSSTDDKQAPELFSRCCRPGPCQRRPPAANELSRCEAPVGGQVLVSTGRQQQTNCLEVAARRCHDQSRGAFVVGQVRVSTSLQQQPYYLQVAPRRCPHQNRDAFVVGHVLVSAGLQQHMSSFLQEYKGTKCRKPEERQLQGPPSRPQKDWTELSPSLSSGQGPASP